MCLILIAWRNHPEHTLVLAANRDEFFDRPTQAARFWDDAPGILAGRDLQQGGTWLGIDRRGRFATVANFREPALRGTGSKSRGLLVSHYLQGTLPAAGYLAEVAGRIRHYDPFNLFAGDPDSLWYLSSRETAPRELSPGLYGISNGDLDCPWPKVNRGKTELQCLLDVASPLPPRERGDVLADSLFALLADRTVPDDTQLPDTGIGIERERKLAPIFVNVGDYGTRSSTMMHMPGDGTVEFEERSYDRRGTVVNTATHVFTVEAR